MKKNLIIIIFLTTLILINSCKIENQIGQTSCGKLYINYIQCINACNGADFSGICSNYGHEPGSLGWNICISEQKNNCETSCQESYDQQTAKLKCSKIN